MDISGKEWHVDRDRTDAIGHQIGVRENSDHSGKRACGIGVDRQDARVRHGGSHVHHVERVVQDEVVDEGPMPRDQGRVLGANHPLADHAHGIPRLASATATSPGADTA